jgi:hypothetical protein
MTQRDKRFLITRSHVRDLQRILRKSRPWYHREFYNYEFHPAVWDALELCRPLDWHLLVLEHPHRSGKDVSMLAYTKDERSGEADRQTVTSIGKYLRRHFPNLQDHEIRDIQALHVASGIKIVNTVAEMIYHLQRGPKSCMVNDFERHPYECYDPQYGWAMAIREEGGTTVGRALVNTSDPDNHIFVRSYRRNDEGYSHSDDQLEAWLRSKGYSKAASWEGHKLKAVYLRNDRYLAPYLDGDCKNTTRCNHHFVIEEDGDYPMNNTCGYTEQEERARCEDCDETFDDYDGHWVGYDETTRVCDSCCDNNYTYAYSRRGNERYILNDNTIHVNGNYYDVDYLDDNEIVCDVDGNYQSIEDVIFIESDNEYYPNNDDRICLTEDTNEYELQEHCWQCEASYNWYTNDCTDYIEIDDIRYHTKYAPEQTKEESNET